MPDELTVAHSWKDEKKPREYNFDGVFGPSASQDKVGHGLGAAHGRPQAGTCCACPMGSCPSAVRHKRSGHAPTRGRPGTPLLHISPKPRPCPTAGRPPTPKVFEDTRHLVQSAVDGYNVCIFAYGQTGSGKTHTIYGSKAAPGLTPRGVTELFAILERQGGRITANVSLYMLELYQVRDGVLTAHVHTHPEPFPCEFPRFPTPSSPYINPLPAPHLAPQDSLMDLLLPAQQRASGPRAPEPPKLEIKKDPRGLVTVQGGSREGPQGRSGLRRCRVLCLHGMRPFLSFPASQCRWQRACLLCLPLSCPLTASLLLFACQALWSSLSPVQRRRCPSLRRASRAATLRAPR
jgi:hypothetical protein